MKTKRLLLGLFSLLAVVCMAFSVIMFNNSNKVGAEDYVVVEIEEGNFVVADGASVRTKLLHPGLRYTVEITTEFYDEMTSKNAKWGALYGVEQADNSALTLLNADGTNVVVGTWDRLTKDDRILPVESIEPFPVIENDEIVGYTYSLVLNPSDESKFSVNYGVRGYVAYEENGEYKISYTDVNNNCNRNVIEVAEKVLLEDAVGAGVYQEEEMFIAREILKAYVNAQYQQLQSIYDVGYIEDFSYATDDTIVVSVPDGDYKVTINDISFDATVENGEAVLAGTANNILGYAIGDKFIAKFVGDNGAYAQSLKVVSKAIRDEADLNDFLMYYYYDYKNGVHNIINPETSVDKYYDGAKFSQRYYVLANDITFNSVEEGSDYYKTMTNDIRGIFDILDGQGHTIFGYSVNQGFFNAIGGVGVIKNLGLNITNIDVAESDENKVAVAKLIGSGSTFENMHIRFSWAGYDTTNSTTKFGVFGESPYYAGEGEYAAQMGFTVTNVYAYVDDSVVPTLDANGGIISSGYFMAGSECNLWGSNWSINNYHVYSKNLDVAVHGKTRHFYTKNATSIPEGDCATHSAAWVTEAPALNSIYYYDDMTTLANKKIGDWYILQDGSAMYIKMPENDIDLEEFVMNNTSAENYSTGTYINKPAYLEDFSQATEDEFVGLNIPAGAYTAYIGSESVEIVVANGKAKIPQGTLAFEIGDEAFVKFVSESGIYYLNVKFVNKAIFNAIDLRTAIEYYKAADKWANLLDDSEYQPLYYDATTFTQRYYVLANDLTISDEWTPARSSVWRDVLDGQGYTLTFELLGYENVDHGIFNKINGGVVKNIAINATQTDTPLVKSTPWGRSFVAVATVDATFENCIFNFDWARKNSVSDRWQPFGYSAQAQFKDVLIQYSDNVKSDPNETAWHGYIGSMKKDPTERTSFENTYVISSGLTEAFNHAEVGVSYAENQIIEGATLNEGLFYYSSMEELLEGVEDGAIQVGDWYVSPYFAYFMSMQPVAMKLGEAMSIEGSDVEYILDGESIVIENGFVVAVKAGTTKVTGVGVESEILVSVYDAVEGFKASAKEELVIGEEDKLVVTDMADKEYIGKAAYAVSEEGIVEIAEDGTITALAEGTVTVLVAVHSNGIVKTLAVNVTVGPALS